MGQCCVCKWSSALAPGKPVAPILANSIIRSDIIAIYSLPMEEPTSFLSLRGETIKHTYLHTPPKSVLYPLYPCGQIKLLTCRSFPDHGILGGSFRSEQHLTQSLLLQPHGLDSPLWDPGNRSEHRRVHVAYLRKGQHCEPNDGGHDRFLQPKLPAFRLRK